MATKFKAYLIHCITNLHAGSGDANYGIIDKLVQRDPVTKYPTIHASSLKGGLREHFENHESLKISVNTIFGKEGDDGADSESGTHRFLNADLVALPVRCTQKQFALSFDKKLVEFINNKAINIVNSRIFGLDIDEENDILFGTHDNNSYAEDYQMKGQPYLNPFTFRQNIIANQYATFKTSHFETLVNNLPVIARNRVGINKNLWYEEVVPHQTIFLTFIGCSQEDKKFDNALKDDLIQIGANASVGYGLCKFFEIEFPETQNNTQ
ncbi:MAG: type III-B CRISPR module RAMP protein Cmr4 [Saprospiraceae bacterium]|nr:type III-B CRISPR module RAMP protein Cmr4 [Saprospiraceae bacterium]